MFYRESNKKVDFKRKGQKKGEKNEKEIRGAFDEIIHPRSLERAFVFPRLLSNRGRNDICRPLEKEIFLHFILKAAS